MTIIIDEAEEALRKGGLVVFPTDTVFGIGCDPFNEDALRALRAAKNRPEEKSIPVLVDSIETAHVLAVIPEYCENLLERHWPGALTIVVKQKSKFSNLISNNDTVALRMPHHEDLLKLITSIGGALVTTSANLSGQPPLLTYDDVYATFSDKASVIVPGSIQGGIASTVIDCTGNNPNILRKGPINLE